MRDVLAGNHHDDATLDLALEWSRTQSDDALLRHRNLGPVTLRHIRELAGDGHARPLRDRPERREELTQDRRDALNHLAKRVLEAPDWEVHGRTVLVRLDDGDGVVYEARDGDVKVDGRSLGIGGLPKR